MMPRMMAEADPGADRGQENPQRNLRLSMLVYGLGNFASCVIARYQLALVLALKQRWKVGGFLVMVRKRSKLPLPHPVVSVDA